MRSFAVLVALVAAVSAIHTAHVPHRAARHIDIARAAHPASPSDVVLEQRAPVTQLKRKTRCPIKHSPTGLPPAKANKPPTGTVPAVNAGLPGGTKTQNGAAPAATRTSAADPWLSSLSIPLNYVLAPQFRPNKTGDLTFYAQGLVACGDTYDDSTYTAAISHFMYDTWPGATAETNRNPVCGPFVKGRYFLSPAEVKVAGSSHATIGGDGLINCSPGETCHLSLTATVHNPQTGVSLRVHIVDRCEGCQMEDIDLAPAAFLRLTRPDLDLTKLPKSQLLTEALKDPQGRLKVDWHFDAVQSFGPVTGV